MRKIFYLTRSYLPEKSGGVLMRVRTVELLRKNGFDVTVVTPNYGKEEIQSEENIIRTPVKVPMKLMNILERTGIAEDYLDPWVKSTLPYLAKIIQKDDIVFATTGGELANIKLASLLKKTTGCKFAANFRDPLDYSLVNGLKLDSSFHVSREKQEYKYLENADLILPSSRTNEMSLKTKYPGLSGRIINNYFGYIEKAPIKAVKGEKHSGTLRIVYGGIFQTLQSPEILARIIESADGVKGYFIGNYKNYSPIQKYIGRKDLEFIPFMPNKEFQEFLQTNCDAAFVSLTSDYLGACVPSKVYEYINLGLPLLGALPEGDAKDIINSKGYGIAKRYDDFAGLREALTDLKDFDKIREIRSRLLNDRDEWSMENRIKEVVALLKSLK